jgi:putative toxin-antitoxin system antitoxin component (TIGR02293 family)
VKIQLHSGPEDISEASVLREPEAPDVLLRVREGLPLEDFLTARGMLGLTDERLARLLGMSRATLHRRKKTGRLDPAESDRLIRYARLFARACNSLGTADEARRWLGTPLAALQDERPLDRADTETGAREVEALLGHDGRAPDA